MTRHAAGSGMPGAAKLLPFAAALLPPVALAQWTPALAQTQITIPSNYGRIWTTSGQ